MQIELPRETSCLISMTQAYTARPVTCFSESVFPFGRGTPRPVKRRGCRTSPPEDEWKKSPGVLPRLPCPSWGFGGDYLPRQRKSPSSRGTPYLRNPYGACRALTGRCLAAACLSCPPRSLLNDERPGEPAFRSCCVGEGYSPCFWSCSFT